MTINRTHLILMTILYKNKATSAGTAITTDEMKTYCNIGKSDSTFNRAFRFLHSQGYISKGVKDGKFSTYYITDNGIKLLTEVM